MTTLAARIIRDRPAYAATPNDLTQAERDAVHEAYYQALSADDAFELAVRAVGARDRWSLRQEQWNDALRVAYRAKVAADNAYAALCRDRRTV